MNASINQIPFILAKFREVAFHWTDKKELEGELNGGAVALQLVPLWVIFCMKTIPLLLIMDLVSNHFVLVEQLFFLDLDELGIAFLYAITAFFAFFSLIFARGVLRFVVSALSLISYMALSWFCLSHGGYGWAFNVGLGVGVYALMIWYGFWDIVLILLKKKQMYYIKNYGKSFLFWKKNKKNERKNLFTFSSIGLFLNIYEEEEDEN